MNIGSNKTFSNVIQHTYTMCKYDNTDIPAFIYQDATIKLIISFSIVFPLGKIGKSENKGPFKTVLRNAVGGGRFLGKEHYEGVRLTFIMGWVGVKCQKNSIT